MCTGTTLLFGIPRVIIGENENFLGAEELLCSNGVEIEVIHDVRCVALMQRLIKRKT